MAVMKGFSNHDRPPEDAEALAVRLHADHADALFTWALGRVPDRRDAEELVARPSSGHGSGMTSSTPGEGPNALGSSGSPATL